MEQDLLDLLDRYPSAKRSLDVDPEFVEASERCQHGEVDHASGLGVETGSAPCPSPGQFGDGPLKGHHEIVAFAQACVDVLATEDVAPSFQPPLEQLTLRHRVAS